MPPADTLEPQDRELLDRLARRIVELRLETPALLTLETARPVSLLASQSIVFFEPFVQALFRMTEYRRFARLVERREAIVTLATLIESHADARDGARSTARDAGRAGNGGA